MELLVKRDRLLLARTDGKAVLDSDAPKFFEAPRYVAERRIRVREARNEKDDLIIENDKDALEMQEHLLDADHPGKVRGGFLPGWLLPSKRNIELPAVWSGYRSAIVRDPETKKWFRLKGISLNPQNPKTVDFEDGTFWIEGGQKKSNAEYERKMSDRFNRVLLSEGIPPVMQYRGMWEYPVLAKRNRPVASIVEILGDTRLDELMSVMETIALHYKICGKKISGKDEMGRSYSNIEIEGYTRLGKNFMGGAAKLYKDIGFVTGRLKRLMDMNGQTWSCDSERSNAHIGNIVVYNGTDKLRVGLVDFDASCDSNDFTKRELKDIQEREYRTIISSAFKGPISLRRMDGVLRKGIGIITDLRGEFVSGFRAGYESHDKNYSNEVNLELLQELFKMLRDTGMFTFSPRSSYSLDDDLLMYNRYRKETEEHRYIEKNPIGSSLEEVISRNYSYQKEINKGKKQKGLFGYPSRYSII